MKLTMLLMIVFLTCELIGCAHVERPDADVCGINFASDAPAHLTCYNIKNDFSSDGVLLPGAKSHKKPIKSPQSLNAGKYISKEDWPAVQVWIQDMRDWTKEHCQ